MPISGVHRPGAGVALDRPGFLEAGTTAGGLPSGADIAAVSTHGFPWPLTLLAFGEKG